MGNAEPCKQMTASGSACRLPALRDGACQWHDSSPGAAEARREAGRRGGRARLRLLPSDSPDQSLATIEDVRAALSRLFNDVLKGAVNHKAASAANAIAKTLLHSFVGDDLAKRMAAIEAALSAKGGAQ